MKRALFLPDEISASDVDGPSRNSVYSVRHKVKKLDREVGESVE